MARRHITDRWATHAPWWQLAIWLRQVTLTFVVNLPLITNNLLGLSDEGDSANRPIIWAVAALAIVVILGAWYYTGRSHEFRFQNLLDTWLYFTDAVVVLMAVIYTLISLSGPSTALDVIGWFALRRRRRCRRRRRVADGAVARQAEDGGALRRRQPLDGVHGSDRREPTAQPTGLVAPPRLGQVVCALVWRARRRPRSPRRR